MNILIDRSNAKASHHSLNQVSSEIKKGHGVVIFPEGTISKVAPKMRPFKNGAFRVAIENQVPIVPISFPDNYKRLEDSWTISSKCGPGLAKIYFHKLIEPKAKEKDLIPLREEVKTAIESKLEYVSRS